MKMAGVGRRNKPNCDLLRTMQLYSSRGWVYRDGQGWVFAELMPDELAEFKSYEYGITIPRMKVRLPYSHAIRSSYPYIDDYVNWFARCTIRQAHPLLLNKFHIHQITNDEQISHFCYPVEPGDYKTWLWADEVDMCRELGYEIAVHGCWCWREWGVPAEWKAPLTRPPRLQCKERTFIYALVDEFVKEVRYVGKSDDPEQRLADHLRDTNNPAKWAWIQSLLVQGRKPKLIILEEVAVAVEFERERYWIIYYWEGGHNLTNGICQYWHKTDKE